MNVILLIRTDGSSMHLLPTFLNRRSNRPTGNMTPAEMGDRNRKAEQIGRVSLAVSRERLRDHHHLPLALLEMRFFGCCSSSSSSPEDFDELPICLPFPKYHSKARSSLDCSLGEKTFEVKRYAIPYAGLRALSTSLATWSIALVVVFFD